MDKLRQYINPLRWLAVVLLITAGLVAYDNIKGGANILGIQPVRFQRVRIDDTLRVDGASTLTGATTQTGALTIAGALAANGGISVDTSAFTVADTSGNVATAGTLTVAGATSLAADVTLSADTTGGNAGAKNEFIGLPRIKLVGGAQGTNPGSQTISLFDDTPDGEYAPVDGDVVESADTTYYKYGAKSYKAAFAATAEAGDGIVGTNAAGGVAYDDMESAGLLVYCSVTWTSGDLTLVLVDDGGARTYNIPALATANKWVWLEVDISSGDLSAVSDVKILLSSQGATNLAAFNLYIDLLYVWDSVDEEALGTAIVQDGVLSVINVETGATLVELTDYIVHYENGNDFIVYITDQSTADIVILVAY
ncbi:MAG: hypothetical protein FJW34_16815 [Acidobacteria bacterium]|nr:hypothetical protein [Acidobacteriota bacterium]